MGFGEDDNPFFHHTNEYDISSTPPLVGFDEDDNPFVHHINKYDISSKIMIIAIISLSVVVFLLVILQMYVRYVLRRPARSRVTVHNVEISNGASLVTSVSQVHSIDPTRNGLDPSVIASIPIFLYKKSDHHDMDKETSVECSVCLSIVEDGEMVRTLPNCKHNFHIECIDKWFNCHSTCPICRTEAKLGLVPEPGEGFFSRIPPLVPFLNVEGTSSSGKIGNE